MPPRPYVLAETNWKAVKSTPFEVAILPWGATEPHNFHLPYGTDNYETSALAERSAEIAWKKGAKVVVLSHFGRPEKGFDPALSLKPMVDRACMAAHGQME